MHIFISTFCELCPKHCSQLVQMESILCIYTVSESIKPMNFSCKLNELTRDNEHPLTTALHRLSVPLQYQAIYCPLNWRALSLIVCKEVNCYLLLINSISIHKAVICPSPCHMWNSEWSPIGSYVISHTDSLYIYRKLFFFQNI